MDVDVAYDQSRLSPLLQLPLELLLRISYHLTTVELGQLRLTCGHIEKSLFPSFAREFFRLKQFNLTEFSLTALVAISRSRLAPHLRYLHIGLESISHARRFHGSRSQAANYRHDRLHTEHWILSTTGQDVVLLAEALRGLPNLEDVVVRDANSSRRSRDGLGATWKSYGDTTFTQQTESPLVNGAAASYDEFASWKVFVKTLQALAAADSRVSGIELLLRRHGVPWTGTFYVPDYLKPTMLPVLARLRKLHLVIGDDYHDPWAPTAFKGYTTSFDLRRFLSYVPNLRDFRFNGYRSEPPVFTMFLEWLATEEGEPLPLADANNTDAEERAIMEASPPAVGFPFLTRLSLGRILIDPGMLERLLRKFAPTLEDLALWEVTLAAEQKQELQVWRSLWSRLAAPESKLDLHRLKVGRQKFSHRTTTEVLPSARFRNGRGEVQYTGPDWRSFAREQLETAVIERYEPPPVVGLQQQGADNSEDDDDGEDDDGEGEDDEIDDDEED
ncbi:F-box domain, cyclin-like protein [Cordyceps fumosorosea ARSEF 2679]|uniref:F-box domain, cyclin-like protein n=1 Tax=Cordyceps fumosorosea (strain ARSEF 2679) TaxID=1081104 RepID=A0A162JQN9_CORFA|nr:F-box domain, cyclin-like protein [Cordyceps fumosorosea ARSEF 2679]OAA72362.1 F-box domain, cyclin-like protein [Cordyceps fumosorosea ARSEF 2679]